MLPVRPIDRSPSVDREGVVVNWQQPVLIAAALVGIVFNFTRICSDRATFDSATVCMLRMVMWTVLALVAASI